MNACLFRPSEPEGKNWLWWETQHFQGRKLFSILEGRTETEVELEVAMTTTICDEKLVEKKESMQDVN